MDFIPRLPLSEGYLTILVVVDWLSTQVHFGALPRSYSAPQVAKLFSQMIVGYMVFLVQLFRLRPSFPKKILV